MSQCAAPVIETSLLNGQKPVEKKTLSKHVEVGKKLLAKCSQDGLFYVATVTKINSSRTECYMDFEHGAEAWCSYKDLQHRRNTSQRSSIKCSLCSGGISQSPNEIVLCDKCGLGFHQACHNPSIEASAITSPDVEWFCRLCLAGGKTKKRKQNQNKEISTKIRSKFTGSRTCFSYKVEDLKWDKLHLTNEEKTYCYCGGRGDWFWQMLQCHKCQHWFHQDCVTCLKYPLILGDRFYLFVCSVCNFGTEYIKRLKLTWDDVVHLTLFYLTMKDHIKYMDLNEVLVPWLESNWNHLQLPQELDCSSKDAKTEHIRGNWLSTMHAKPMKYKNGKEIKKKYSWWGLRNRFPPFPPSIGSLGEGAVTDEMVASALQKGSIMNHKNPSYDGLQVPLRWFANKPKSQKVKRTASEADLSQPHSKKRKTSTGSNTTSVNKDSQNQNYKGHISSSGNYLPLSGSTNQGTKSTDSPAKISLDYVIPCPTNFYGVNHPFKTILERDEELEHVKMKARLLNNYSQCNGTGISDDVHESASDSCTDSHIETESDTVSLTPSETIATEALPAQKQPLIKSLFRNLPKIKRRKRGRPSKAELKALEDRVNAAHKMGITDTNYIIQSCPTNSNNNTPKKAKEKKGRTKNVVDKSTLDSMSEKEVSITQLKSSVNNYFGAANRLATGEGFKVRARRVTPDGKCQYLVEWEGGIIG